MNDGQALYQAICENPDDDTTRLVYADWLEEQGEDEYARYIRTSISLRNPPDEESFENVMEWGEKQQWCSKYEKEYRNILTKTMPIMPGMVLARGKKWEFERGFIKSVECTIDDIFLPGMYNVGPNSCRILHCYTLLAERLVRETPIIQLILMDVYPFSYMISQARMIGRRTSVRAQYKYRWMSPDTFTYIGEPEPAQTGELPMWLFDKIWYNPKYEPRKYTVMTQSQPSTRYIEFDTVQQAREALGEVLCRDIREMVYGSKKT